VQSPANQETAKVDGVEINLQHNFGDSGYGMIANATFVNADVAYDNMKIDSQFVLNGLSDSANLVAFYDKDGFQARLAYNWRDAYLAGVGQGAGTYTNPTNVESYGQLDISASYDYSDNLTIFFAGLNVLEETYNVYGRAEQQVLQAGQTGARYDIGVRYTF
jgi:TonB-dependent receptor